MTSADRVVLYDDLEMPVSYPSGKLPEINFIDLSKSMLGVAAFT